MLFWKWNNIYHALNLLCNTTRSIQCAGRSGHIPYRKQWVDLYYSDHIKDDICYNQLNGRQPSIGSTVYPKKYAHGFVELCFVVVMQSFIMNSHEVFIHIHQDCFAGTGAIVRLPQCQWSKPDGHGKISQCITTTKHSKAKTVCIFLGIYCTSTITCPNSCPCHGPGLTQ